MAEPTINCPKCGTEIRLTESLAAPMLASVRNQYEDRLLAKDTEISNREASLRDQQAAVAKAQATVDEQVATKLNTERAAIAAEEAKKARLALESDLTGKDRLITDLNETVKTMNTKLATAQKAEVDLIRQAIVERFGDMHEDLEKERSVMTKQWAKREEQIRGVIESTAGMYGDLQGIAGKTLQEIEGLDLRLLGNANAKP